MCFSLKLKNCNKTSTRMCKVSPAWGDKGPKSISPCCGRTWNILLFTAVAAQRRHLVLQQLTWVFWTLHLTQKKSLLDARPGDYISDWFVTFQPLKRRISFSQMNWLQQDFDTDVCNAFPAWATGAKIKMSRVWRDCRCLAVYHQSASLREDKECSSNWRRFLLATSDWGEELSDYRTRESWKYGVLWEETEVDATESVQFKSLDTIFMYRVFPPFIRTVWTVWINCKQRVL